MPREVIEVRGPRRGPRPDEGRAEKAPRKLPKPRKLRRQPAAQQSSALPVFDRSAAIDGFAGGLDGQHLLVAFLGVQQLLRLLRCHLARRLSRGRFLLLFVAFVFRLLG